MGVPVPSTDGSSTFSAWWSRIVHILNYNTFRLNYVDFWGHNDVVSNLSQKSIYFGN